MARRSEEGHADELPVTVVGAAADAMAVARLVRLLDLPEGPSASGDQPIVVVAVSSETVKDASLVARLEQRLSADGLVIPVAVHPAVQNLPSELQQLHHIAGHTLPDDELRDQLLHTIRMDPAAAASFGSLMASVNGWNGGGRRRRDLLDATVLRRMDTLWQSLPSAVTSGDEELVQAYLSAGWRHLHLVRRARAAAVVVAGLAVLVTAVVIVLWQRDRNAAADQAALAERERLASAAAVEARSAMRAGDQLGSLRAALRGLDSASTRDIREATRQVLSVPMPDTTFRLGARPSTLAWSRTGRFLAVGLKPGTLWLLDVARRKHIGSWTSGSGAIDEVRFVERAGLVLLVFKPHDAAERTVETGLPVEEGQGPDVRDTADPHRSASGRIHAEVDQGGTQLLTVACHSKQNGSCSMWLPPTAGVAIGGAWSPAADVLAVATSDGDVDVVDAAAVMARSTVLDLEVTGTPSPDDRVGQLDGHLVMMSPRGRVTVAVPGTVPTDGTAWCRRTVQEENLGRDWDLRFAGVDCRGVVDWTADLRDIIAAIPLAQDDGSAPGERPVSVAASVVVSPTGTTAVALDSSGVALLLVRAESWTVVVRAAAGGSGAGGPTAVFAADGMTAVMLVGQSTGATDSAVVFDVGRRSARVFPIGHGEAESHVELRLVSNDGRTAVIGGTTVGEKARIRLLDLRSGHEVPASDSFGAPAALDVTGTRVLTVGGDVDAMPWPTKTAGNGTLSFARIYQTADGELLCQAPFYQPYSVPAVGTPLVAPDLSATVTTYEAVVVQRTCDPDLELRPAVEARIAGFIDVSVPR
ncbi:hypothetical protein AB0K00_26965 [Dactylosporangium sp. NPDC049525]|uniref:hypothetical protein n=1 Tax=Dactylosporangium sp. NPDC049525 TaxID=3154730 RepID=UPI00342D1B74